MRLAKNPPTEGIVLVSHSLIHELYFQNQDHDIPSTVTKQTPSEAHKSNKNTLWSFVQSNQHELECNKKKDSKKIAT